MTHWPKSVDDLWYRFILLRRLTLACIVIVALGAWGAVALYHMHDTSGVLIGLGVCAAILILHNLLFPAGWIDALGLSAAMALCFLIYPTLLLYASTGSGAVGIAFLLVPVLGFLATCMAIAGSFGWFPVGQISRQNTWTLPLQAEDVRACEFFQPGVEMAFYKTGGADENGLFPVWYNIVAPDAENGFELPDAAALANRPPDFHKRILEQSDTRQLVQTFLNERTGSGDLKSSVCEVVVEALGPESCRYELREVHNVWNLHVLVQSWLCDFNGDCKQKLIDAATGSSGKALFALPQVTMLSLIARFCARSGLADPG